MQRTQTRSKNGATQGPSTSGTARRLRLPNAASRWSGALSAAALGAALLTPAPALALQGGEDPSLLPVLVDKRFGMDGAHQLSLQFSTSFATKLVESVGIYATYGYNFTDIFGLELGGGYFFGSESSIMQTVRATLGSQEPPFSDLYQLQWMANLNAVLVPFYGRISFASELDPAWDFFALAGGGAFGIRKQVGGADGSSFDSTVTAGFNFGAGLRFYFNLGGTRMALRLEFREYFFPDPANNPSNDPMKNNDSLTWNLHFQSGLQFAFGGP